MLFTSTSTTTKRFLHYAGDSLLFSDHANVLDSIKIGSSASIANAASGSSAGQPVLDIIDRALDGTIASDHEITSAYFNTNGLTIANPYQQPCSESAAPGAYPNYAPLIDDMHEPLPGLIDDGLNLISGDQVYDPIILGSVNQSRSPSDCTAVASTARRVLDDGCGGDGGGGSDGPGTIDCPVGAECYGHPVIGRDPSAPSGGGDGDGGGDSGGGDFGSGGLGGGGGGLHLPPPTLPPPYKQIGHVAAKPAPLLIPGLGSIWLYYATSSNGACYWGITCRLEARTRAQVRMGRTIRNAWQFPEGTLRAQAMNVETYQMNSTNTLQPGSPGYNQVRSISPNGVNGSYYDPEAAANMAEGMEVGLPEIPDIPIP